jgi:hypothetical protein
MHTSFRKSEGTYLLMFKACCIPATDRGIEKHNNQLCQLNRHYTAQNTASSPLQTSNSALAPYRVSLPEPSTWAMMLLGFAGLGFAFRRKVRI